MKPNNVTPISREQLPRAVPIIPQCSLSRPFSGWIFRKILIKTENPHLSFCQKVALRLNLVWCVLFIPMDMVWNIILLPITFISMPFKYTFGMIPGKYYPIGHKMLGIKDWARELKLIFICILEVGILPISLFIPRKACRMHHKLVGYNKYLLKGDPKLKPKKLEHRTPPTFQKHPDNSNHSKLDPKLNDIINAVLVAQQMNDMQKSEILPDAITDVHFMSGIEPDRHEDLLSLLGPQKPVSTIEFLPKVSSPAPRDHSNVSSSHEENLEKDSHSSEEEEAPEIAVTHEESLPHTETEALQTLTGPASPRVHFTVPVSNGESSEKEETLSSEAEPTAESITDENFSIPERQTSPFNFEELTNRLNNSPEVQTLRLSEPKARPNVLPSLEDSELFNSVHFEDGVANDYLLPESQTEEPSSIQPEAEDSLSAQGSLILEPTSFSRNDGTGPTILGQIVGTGVTAFNLMAGGINRFMTTSNTEVEAILNNTGTQLNSALVRSYLYGLKEEMANDKIYLLDDFYASPHSTLKNFTADSLKEHLQEHKKYLKKEETVVIPLVLPSESLWVEVNHIVVVLITRDTLEYYDSKGTQSKYFTLSDGFTLYNALEVMKDVFMGENRGTIKENRTTQQNDINNCGVFVCKFIHDRLKIGASFRKIRASHISREEITNFRLGMLPLILKGKEQLFG